MAEARMPEEGCILVLRVKMGHLDCRVKEQFKSMNGILLVW